MAAVPVRESATVNAEDDLSRRLAELKSRGWWISLVVSQLLPSSVAFPSGPMRRVSLSTHNIRQ
jgi:hypothetical protein